MSNMRSRPSNNRNNGRPMQRRPNGGSNGGSNGRRQQSNGGGHQRRGGGNMNAGAALAARDKYLEKAKEAMSEGDRVSAENYFQHADHYNRIVIEAEERRQEEACDSEKDGVVDGSCDVADAEVEGQIPVVIADEALINSGLTDLPEEAAL